MKREFYPELNDKFKPPKHVPEVAVGAPDVEEDDDADYIEENDNNEDDNLPVRQPNFEENVTTPIRSPSAQKSVQVLLEVEVEQEILFLLEKFSGVRKDRPKERSPGQHTHPWKVPCES